MHNFPLCIQYVYDVHFDDISPLLAAETRENARRGGRGVPQGDAAQHEARCRVVGSGRQLLVPRRPFLTERAERRPREYPYFGEKTLKSF